MRRRGHGPVHCTHRHCGLGRALGDGGGPVCLRDARHFGGPPEPGSDPGLLRHGQAPVGRTARVRHRPAARRDDRCRDQLCALPACHRRLRGRPLPGSGRQRLRRSLPWSVCTGSGCGGARIPAAVVVRDRQHGHPYVHGLCHQRPRLNHPFLRRASAHRRHCNGARVGLRRPVWCLHEPGAGLGTEAGHLSRGVGAGGVEGAVALHCRSHHGRLVGCHRLRVHLRFPPRRPRHPHDAHRSGRRGRFGRRAAHGGAARGTVAGTGGAAGDACGARGVRRRGEGEAPIGMQ
mmetsp:Transcript_8975/g.29733  ORF Transcript_8975/g.29733 Transcript_8975/m.29733 type:complete len:290 (+) Transcript_8975:244-1113(+)